MAQPAHDHRAWRWIAGLSGGAIVVLLALGERTLPLFAGDRVLAERAYQAGFLVLITGVVVGVVPPFFARLAAFGHRRIAETDAPPPAVFRFTVRTFEVAGPWLSAAIGIAGLVLAAELWFTGP